MSFWRLGIINLLLRRRIVVKDFFPSLNSRQMLPFLSELPDWNSVG